MMAANAGVIKAIVNLYCVNSDTAFERHRSRILINDLNTIDTLEKHLIQFLGLKELTIKYGLGDFDAKRHRMAPKPGGKSDNFAITDGRTTSGSWGSQVCWMTKKKKKTDLFMLHPKVEMRHESHLEDCFAAVAVAEARLPPGEYETDSGVDFSDREDEYIAPVPVSRSGRSIRAHFRLGL